MGTINHDLGDKRHGAFQWRPSAVRPGKVVLLWLVYMVLCIIDTLFFPSDAFVSPALIVLVSVVPVLAGLAAAWALHLRATSLGLVKLLLSITVSFQIVWMLIEWAFADRMSEELSSSIIFLITISAIIIAISFGFSHRSKKRRATAIALTICIFIGVPAAGSAHYQLWDWTAKAQNLIGKKSPWDEDDTTHPMPDVTADVLWEHQSELARKELSGLEHPLSEKQNVYALAVAADGSQQLFGREASLALNVAQSRFGDAYRGGVLLSNSVKDIMHRPLAVRANFAAIAKEIGTRIDPSRDLFFIYLASHGSTEAELSTSLPDYERLSPISAKSVAGALEKAEIKRRVIIVSACYAASWIPALARRRGQIRDRRAGGNRDWQDLRGLVVCGHVADPHLDRFICPRWG